MVLWVYKLWYHKITGSVDILLLSTAANCSNDISLRTQDQLLTRDNILSSSMYDQGHKFPYKYYISYWHRGMFLVMLPTIIPSSLLVVIGCCPKQIINGPKGRLKKFKSILH